METLPRNRTLEETPGQQPLNAPATPLPPLQMEGLQIQGSSPDPLNKRADSGMDRPFTPDITNHKPEANKADKMCEKIDHSVNLLALTGMAHMLAANYYYKRYCMLAVLSITVSSIVAVGGRILPAGMVGTGAQSLHRPLFRCHGTATKKPPRTKPTPCTPVAVSAFCNALNTLMLGLMALMRFESKSMLHTKGACTLQSLKVRQVELRDQTPPLPLPLSLHRTLTVSLASTLTVTPAYQIELRDKLQQIVHGFQHDVALLGLGSGGGVGSWALAFSASIWLGLGLGLGRYLLYIPLDPP